MDMCDEYLKKNTHKMYSRRLQCYVNFDLPVENGEASPSSCPIISQVIFGKVSRPDEFEAVGLKSYVCNASLV